ncbi:MAG: FtsX-like permease family protein [Bacteroidota bacterium]
MNIFTLSWKNLQAKPLSTLLSLLLLALGVGIISLLLLLNRQLEEQFNKNIKGIDMVVGAKGSPLQLILSSVYHIDYPTGNISKAAADSLIKNPMIDWHIPLAYGDNLQSFRIVGTTYDYPKHYEVDITEGRLWDKTLEASLGARVAEELGLKVGDQFFSSHGLSSSEDVHKESAFTVVGIFEPSNTVIDQLILCSVSSIYAVHNHVEGEENEENDDHEHAEHEHGEEEYEKDHEAEAKEAIDLDAPDQELTTMLIGFRGPMGMVTIPRMVNERTSMQAALPAIEINRLWSLMGIGINTLRGIALAIMVISGISVFISLYNSLKERKYELALMRSLGASRGKIFALILLEGLVLSLLGFTLGIILSRGGLWLLSRFVASDYHYDISSLSLLPEEGYLLIGTLLIGFLAAVIPALKGFGLNISQTLAEKA